MQSSSRSLVATEREECLRKRLTAAGTAGVKPVFDACSFDRCAQEELANVEFDDLFKTPLHIAIAVGSTELQSVSIPVAGWSFVSKARHHQCA